MDFLSRGGGLNKEHEAAGRRLDRSRPSRFEKSISVPMNISHIAVLGLLLARFCNC